MLITDPWFYLVAVPAVFLTGISKAGVGAGLGMLAVPLMSLVIAPTVAAAIMLPILCSMDLLGVREYRKDLDWALLKSLLPGALLGIVVAALLFRLLSVKGLLLILGVECLLFAGYQILNRTRIAAAPPAAPHAVKAFIASALSGFTSTIAHAGNPPLAQYLIPLRIPKITYVAATVFFFTTVNLVKLVPYGYLGLLDATNLLTSLVLVPIVPFAFKVGVRIMRKIPERYFFQVLVWCLLFLGLRLTYQGLV